MYFHFKALISKIALIQLQLTQFVFINERKFNYQLNLFLIEL